MRLRKRTLFSLDRILTGVVVLLLIGLGWFLLASEPASADYLTVSFQGGTQLEIDTLEFEAKMTPSAIQVGDITTLELTLINRGQDPAAPTVEIELPDTLQLAVEQLRGGVTFNFQTRTLTWQPVIAGGDTLLTAAVPLTAVSTNPDQPEVEVPIVIESRGRVERITAEVWVGEPAVGQILLNPPRASIGQPIQLFADIEGSGPIQQVWVLGDGRVVPATDPIVVYPQAGTYTLELQVVNPLGTSRSQEVIVIGPEPAAYFRPSDTTPAVGQEILFENQSGGEGPLQYEWNFGDGTTSNSPTPTHRYSTPGTYDVLLTVTNPVGQAQNFVQITVGQPPIADAIIPEVVEAGQALTGQAFTDSDLVEVLWDFGDGKTATGEQVEYIYPTGGDYVVTVNAVNAFGNTTISRIVRVNGGAFFIYLPMVTNSDGATIILPNSADSADTEEALLAQTVELIENDSEIVLVSNPEIAGWSLESQLIWYINEARQQAGLNPVIVKDELSRAAKIHTDDMATAMFTSHTGSDGSAPYERIARTAYREGGYAGEATAWGFADPIDAVDFWLNSPPHRAILLNPLADHIGTAETTNFNAPSIWYWTAEFASSRGSIEAQMQEAGIRLVSPPAGASYEFTETAILSWVWPLPLAGDQGFGVYVGRDSDQMAKVATVREPLSPEQPFEYGFPIGATEMAQQAGEYGWMVRLETFGGDNVSTSEFRPVELTGRFPTPVPTEAPLIIPPTAFPTLTPTPTVPFNPTALPPTAAPLETVDTGVLPSPTPTETLAPANSPTPLPTVTPLPTATPSLTPTQTPTPFVLPTVETSP